MTYIPGGSGGGGQVSTSDDVALNNPATGQTLTYNASIAKWVNGVSVTPVVQLTQADYDALAEKDPNILYVVVG